MTGAGIKDTLELAVADIQADDVYGNPGFGYQVNISKYKELSFAQVSLNLQSLVQIYQILCNVSSFFGDGE